LTPKAPRLRILICFNGSLEPEHRNMNAHQRCHYLAQHADVELIVRRDASIDSSIMAAVHLRRARFPGVAGLTLALLIRSFTTTANVVITDRSIVSLGGWLGTRRHRTAWVADIWDSPSKELVTFYRSSTGGARFRRMASRLKVWCLRRLLCRADLVIASIHSDGLRSYHIQPSRLRAYKNAITIDEMSISQHTMMREPNSICYASSLFLPDRGLGTLVNAVRHLAERNLCVTVDLVGTIPASGLALIWSSDVAERFRLHGAREAAALWDIMRRCEVGVVPFDDNDDIRYTFPVKLLEYMVAGCVVVASDLPGTRMVLTGRNGILVPPSNPRALAEALASILMDADRAQSLREAARDSVVKYASNRKGERILSELQVLASQRRTTLNGEQTMAGSH